MMSRKPVRRALLLAIVAAVTLVGLGLATTTYLASRASAAQQEIDPSYANGTTVYMIGPHMITNPNPNLLAQAEPLYILAYPVNSNPVCTSDCAPTTLPSGYQPQCNPCFHPGLPPVFAYHDHVLEGAPAAGDQCEPALAPAAKGTLDGVAGAGADVEFPAAGRLFHRNVNADARALISRIGQGGQAVRGAQF